MNIKMNLLILIIIYLIQTCLSSVCMLINLHPIQKELNFKKTVVYIKGNIFVLECTLKTRVTIHLISQKCKMFLFAGADLFVTNFENK